MAEKYYSISPYAYVGNNPIKYVDLRGDSLSLAKMQFLDNSIGTNFTENIINDIQSQTGLNVTIGGNGVMKYAKDTNDNPSVATTTDASGNIVQSGSVTARNLIIAAIDHADMVEVVHAGKSGVPPGTNQLRLSINQINQFIKGSVNVDNRTFGWGMTFMHELHHTQVGGGLDDSPGNPGPVVTQMNIIRSELNAQGGNYGQRLDYMATPFGTYNYIPFSNSARNSIINGFTPRNSVKNKFIKY